MAANWWDSYKRADDEEKWWESYKRADESSPEAGGGRGFVNPPMAFEPQPVRPAPAPAPLPASVDYGQAATDMMGTPTAIETALGRSVLDQPDTRDRTQDVGFMLRPEFVQQVRNDFAKVPADKRREALIAAASGESGVNTQVSLAAQRILAEVKAEDDMLRREGTLRQGTIDLLAKAPPGQPAAPKRGSAPALAPQVNFPDMTPTFGETLDMLPEQERVQQRLRRDDITRGVVAAETSLPAISDRAERAARDYQAEAFAQDNPKLAAFASGAGQNLAGLLNAVPTLMDFATRLVDKDATRYGNAPGVDGIVRTAQSYLPKEAQQDVTRAWEKGQFGEWLGYNLLAQAPQMASHVIAAIVPATRPFILPAMGAMSAGQSFAQGDSSLAAVLKGGAEIAGEKVTLGVFDKTLSSLSKLPLSLQASTVQAVGKRVAAFGGAVTAQHLAGAIEEATTQVLQNGVDRFVEGKNTDLLDKVVDAAVLGAFMEGPLAVPQAARAFQSGESAFAEALQGDIDSARFVPSQAATIEQLRTEAGTSTMITPAATVANFTPADSATKRAGLVDIVVPLPGAATAPTLGDLNVGTAGVPGGLVGAGGEAGGGVVAGGLGAPGLGATGAAGVGDGSATIPGVDGRSTILAGGEAGQSLASLNRPLNRASDADLLARTEAAVGGEPLTWTGRAKTGYATEQDAEQAMATASTVIDTRQTHDWRVEPMGNGRFQIVGYQRGDASGTAVTGAAGQGLAATTSGSGAQQPGVAGAGVVDLGQGGGNPPGLPGGASTVGGAAANEPAFNLKLAPPAPLRAAGQAITMLKTSRGVDVELHVDDLTDQQKVASAMARLVGKTVTYMDYVAGPADKMPNGFVIPGKEKNIYLDSKSDDGALFVMMHEGVHALPQPIREKLVTTIKGLTKTEMRGDFAQKFGYNINNEAEIDNEIAAFMTQAVSKRQDFWQELRTKMGDGDFTAVAKVIIEKLDTFIKGAKSAYGDEFVNRYATDAVAVRDAVSTAYADAMKAQGQQAPAAVTTAAAPGITASNRAADVNTLGMYSELARKIDAGPGQAMPDQWRGYIRGLTTKGVKPDEIEWSGVEDFLELKRAAGQKVTKAEVAEYLKQGGVRVEETVLRDSGDEIPFLDNAAKYGQYTLPGGENYREVLLTLPSFGSGLAMREALEARYPGKFGRELYLALTPQEKAVYDREIEANKFPGYRSSHWDAQNVLAHIRVNDRVDAGGDRVLFVEELQSDWGQEGKKRGFGANWEIKEAPNGKFQILRNGQAVGGTHATKAIAERLLEQGRGNDNVIPAAPFVTKTEGWLNLALKRVMVMAAEGGYDKVAFVNGEQSADRYDLSKQIESVTAQAKWSGDAATASKWHIEARRKGDRGIVINAPYAADELADVIGKDLAEKIVSEVTPDNPLKRYSGLDLKVGGEGMKTFYDAIVPSALKKLLPKVGGGQLTTMGIPETAGNGVDVALLDRNVWGVKTGGGWLADDGRTVLRSAEARRFGTKEEAYSEARVVAPTLQQPGFDVTPAMLEKVATSGLPMFSNKEQEPAIGARLRERIQGDYEGAAQEYAALKGTKGGRLLDTDIARELSPEYRENRNRAADVHEAASDFIQRTFESRMAQPGQGEIVTFMAGGGGSGKSSAEKLLAPILDRSGTILDGTLSNYDKARRNVKMVLDSGRKVEIAYVYREPVEALRNGVLTRAMRGGRTVPLDALVKGHAGSSDVVRKLQAEFGDDPNFDLSVVDNSRGPGGAVISSLESITPVTIEGLKERFTDATEDEFRAGRISEGVYRASLGRTVDAGAEAQGRTGVGQVQEGLEVDAEQGRGSEQTRDALGKPARRGTQRVGDFDVRTMKDGTIVVYGDAEAIRAQIPEDVKGRNTKEGIVFTNASAPRVKAALAGRKTAYSRGGQVTEKLPMKDGKYLGAPEKYNTPGKIVALRKQLRMLTLEGERGRFWYENSSLAILRMTGGNVQEARKFVALLAIYSPQARVDSNSTFALRAWAQYKAGQPISVKTGVQDKKATEAMADVDAFWSGEKTGNFFFNLLREIDTSTAGKQGATIDMWMMRAAEYSNDAPTATQYAFMENETNRIAQEMGWEPQQVQAAIWVAMKARMENKGVKQRTEDTSEKKGWIRFDYPMKNGRPFKTRVILKAQDHRDNWLKHAMEHVPTKEDTEQAKFDFADGVGRHIGQLSFEARPGRSTGVLDGIHAAPYAQQVEFQQAVQRAFYDENGVDMLAVQLGLLSEPSDIMRPGVWQGDVSPSTQKRVAMAPAGGDAGKTNVDPAQAELLNVYASVAGLVARQEGVGWHRPFYAGTKRDANGLEIDIGRALNPAETRDLEAAIGKWMDDNKHADWQNSFALISSPTGIRVVNFGIITNGVLQSEIVKVAEGVLPDGSVRVFASSGDMPTNDWKANPNGQTYVQRIGAAGRSDVLDWARSVLAPRVQRVFEQFAEKYQWGDPGRIQFSNRAGSDAAGGGRDRGVGQEDVRGQATPSYGTPREGASAAVGYHYSTQPRTTLSSGMYGTGLRGAEMQRLQGADRRLSQRTYFYIDRGTGINPEAGVGGYAHRVNLQNLYDADEDTLRLQRDAVDFNGFESAVIDAGFDGYMVRQAGPSGNAVLLGQHAVPVEQLGSAGRMETDDVVPAARERVLSDAEKIASNKMLPAGQVTGKRWGELISRAMPEVYGRLADSPVWQSDKAMYRSELAKELRASATAPAFSNRALPKVSPQSALEADIASSAEKLSRAVEAIRRDPDARVGPKIRLGRLPHVLNMLGARTQDMDIARSIVHKIFVDPEKHRDEFSSVTPEQFVRALYRPALVLQSRKAENEMELVLPITGDKGAVIVPVVISRSNADPQAAIKSAYQYTVSQSFDRGGDSIMRRVNEGALRYVDMASAPATLTGRAKGEALTESGPLETEGLEGGFNDAGRVPTTQPPTSLTASITNVNRAVNDRFVAWPPVAVKMRELLAQRKVRDEVSLMRWIGNNYKPESSDLGWDDAPAFSNRAAKPELDKDVVSLFKDLQDSRGLGRIRVQERVDAHPMAETIRRVDKEFLDILERLDDTGLVSINCK